MSNSPVVGIRGHVAPRIVVAEYSVIGVESLLLPVRHCFDVADGAVVPVLDRLSAHKASPLNVTTIAGRFLSAPVGSQMIFPFWKSESTFLPRQFWTQE